jgi:hypothetical protein
VDVMKLLRDLYARATHESTPIDEARAAAYVLLKKAKENGVTLSFRRSGTTVTTDGEEMGKARVDPPAPPRPPPANQFFRRCPLCGRLGLHPSQVVCGQCLSRYHPEPPEPKRCCDCRRELASDARDRCDDCLTRLHQEEATRRRRPSPAGAYEYPAEMPADFQAFVRDIEAAMHRQTNRRGK